MKEKDRPVHEESFPSKVEEAVRHRLENAAFPTVPAAWVHCCFAKMRTGGGGSTDALQPHRGRSTRMKERNRLVHEESLDSMVAEIVRLRAENAALVRQTASSATAFPTDRGDAAASRGLTKLEWMAGMVESGNVGINGPVLSVHDVVRRAAHILAECRNHEAQ
jgi:hypothetical protein